MCADRPSFHLGLDRESYYLSMPIGLRHSIPFVPLSSLLGKPHPFRLSTHLLVAHSEAGKLLSSAAAHPFTYFGSGVERRGAPTSRFTSLVTGLSCLVLLQWEQNLLNSVLGDDHHLQAVTDLDVTLNSSVKSILNQNLALGPC